MIQSQIDPLADEINDLHKRTSELNINDITRHYYEKLDQWRNDCYIMIDEFYGKKLQELNQRCRQRVDSLQIELDQMRIKLSDLLSKEKFNNDDLEAFTLNIGDVKQKLFQLDEKAFQIAFHPLKINEDLISIEDTRLHELNLCALSKPYRKLESTDHSWPAMVANDQVLLVDQYPNIILIDRDLKILKQTSWSSGFIRNICWSSLLSSFIAVNNEKQLFLIKENTLSYERIYLYEEQYWWSCTCSDTSLFLSNATMGSNVFQFSLSSSFSIVEQWKPPVSCRKNEYIDDMGYNNGTLAFVIKVSSKSAVVFELRTSSTLDRIWVLQLDVKRNWFQQNIRCCSLMYDEWLVIEGNSSKIFHVRKHGSIKSIGIYKPSPMNAVLFGDNILAIRTKANINFHRL